MTTMFAQMMMSQQEYDNDPTNRLTVQMQGNQIAKTQGDHQQEISI
jgi:hypothetical protein